jgi:hypothetical protein
MKARTMLLELMLLPLLCAIAVPARAQTANPQDTLNQYIADLQSNPNDTALRGKIIALAQSMSPPPAIPEEARRHYMMAETFVEKAKNDTERARDDSGLKQAATEFEQAIVEFKSALLAAPWWPEANRDYALTLEAAERFDEATAYVKLYMATNPGDERLRAAQDEIYKIEARKKLAASDQIRRQQEQQQQAWEAQQRAQQAQRARDEEDRRAFEGTWCQLADNGTCQNNTIFFWTIRPSGGVLTITIPFTRMHLHDVQQNGRHLKVTQDLYLENGPLWSSVDYDLTLSPDGQEITGTARVISGTIQRTEPSTFRRQ